MKEDRTGERGQDRVQDRGQDMGQATGQRTTHEVFTKRTLAQHYDIIMQYYVFYNIISQLYICSTI